jgi:iron complex transport system substrate-binding protein
MNKKILLGLIIFSLYTGISYGANRIVVLNADAIKILVALGATDRIVGMADKKPKLSPSLLKDVPEVGSLGSPNIEAIVKLEPDVVIAYDSWPSQDFLEDKLLPFGIKVLRIACYKINSFTEDIKILGNLVGKEKRAQEFIEFFQKYLGLILERTKGIKKKLKVYLEYQDYSTVSGGSGGDELLKIVGLENIASEFKIPFPKVSPEWVLAKNPDVIIKVPRLGVKEVNEDIFKELINRPGWKELKAVKEGKVHLVSYYEIWAGPKAIIGALYLAKWCYPDAFLDINPEAIHKELAKKFYHEDLKGVYVWP